RLLRGGIADMGIASPLRRLWRNTHFLLLWAGTAVSLFGSQVTFIALPFTAALVLHASPTQMGLLAAANTLPLLLVSLFAGVWVDRWRRRPVLLWADGVRALLLGLVPILALLQALRIEALYAVAFLVGLATVFFDTAYGAFLPSVVPSGQL